MRKLVAEAADWLRAERKRLGLSSVDIALGAADMADDFRWGGEVPNVEDIRALEREEPKQLPRWFKLLRYVIDRAAAPDQEALAWLGERNYYWSRGPLKMARPYVFEDEYRFLNTLDAIDEEQRRALRAFVSNWTYRQGYDTKENFARAFLAKFGITASVLDDDDRELVERFQMLSGGQRKIVMNMMRNIPASPPTDRYRAS